MSTLQEVSDEVQQRGFMDAYYGRMYKHSLTDYYAQMGLIDVYDIGWDEGRDRKEADNRRG